MRYGIPVRWTCACPALFETNSPVPSMHAALCGSARQKAYRDNRNRETLPATLARIDRRPPGKQH